MARAQLAALKGLGAKKVALITPYLEELSIANAAMLTSGGVIVVKRLTMGLDRDELTSAVTPDCIAEWAIAADCEEAEVVVIGCSAFRACGVGFIDSLETRLRKPVVTSIQAFLWRMLRLAGVDDAIDGYGELLKNH